MKKEIKVEKNILTKNDEAADRLRALFAQKKVLVLNLLSSPGSGKTSLLEKTAESLGKEINAAVVVGDLQTERDADRVRNLGVEAIQINTGRGCHLNAKMVSDVLPQLDVDNLDVLFIENVGNLVCPATFDLGEDAAVLLASTTEGDDKPAKYPTAVLKGDLVVLNKMDLAPYTNFSVERFRSDVQKIKAGLDVLEISCTTGQGLQDWFKWLKTRISQKKQA